jgi:hypothetical protein
MAGLADDLAHAMALAGAATIAEAAGIAWMAGAGSAGGRPG